MSGDRPASRSPRRARGRGYRQRGGHGMHDVAERAEPHEQHSHSRSAQEVARRVILRIADDRDAAAVARRRSRARARFPRCSRCPCSARRAEQLEQRRHGGVGEDDDPVHAAQGRDDLGAIAARPGSDAPAPLSRRTDSSSLIATIRRSASRPRRLQVAHVADVQQIEAAVGEAQSCGRRARDLRDERVRRSCERDHRHHAQTPPRDGCAGAELGRRHRGGAALHHDDAAGVIGQPRGLVEGRAGGERQRHRRDDGVAGAGDVGDLIGPEDRNVRVGLPARRAPCRGCRA